MIIIHSFQPEEAYDTEYAGAFLRITPNEEYFLDTCDADLTEIENDGQAKQVKEFIELWQENAKTIGVAFTSEVSFTKESL